jgi:hypothetical protein
MKQKQAEMMKKRKKETDRNDKSLRLEKWIFQARPLTGTPLCMTAA